MKRYDLITPDGTKDLMFGECALKREIEEKLRGIFISRGYREIQTPGMEFFDVFAQNSSHFPQEILYKLTDSNGRLLVLRPDSTMPIARMTAARLKNSAMPLRIFYNQNVYAINRQLTGRSDEITQVGIELIGSASRLADIEVLSTALDVLKSCVDGRNDGFSLEIGDAGIFKELAGLLNATAAQKEEIRRFVETKNYPALDSLFKYSDKNSPGYALRKLPKLFGGAEVFEKAKILTMGGANTNISEILENLEGLFNGLLEINENAGISVDLGLVNRTDYYTGVIIKGYLAGHGGEVLYGGRYDKLLAEFGTDIPAIGFAADITALCKVLGKNCETAEQASDVIVFAEAGCEAEAVRTADIYRAGGKVAELALFGNIDDVKEYAKECGIKKIVIASHIDK